MYSASPRREDVARQPAWTVGISKNNISPLVANAHRSCLVLEEIHCWVQRISRFRWLSWTPKGKYGVAAARKRSPALSTLEGRVLYFWHMEEQCTAAARKCVSCLSCSGRDVLQGSIKTPRPFRSSYTSKRRNKAPPTFANAHLACSSLERMCHAIVANLQTSWVSGGFQRKQCVAAVRKCALHVQFLRETCCWEQQILALFNVTDSRKKN
jgi:hypothetical protein